MSIALVITDRDLSRWKSSFEQALPNVKIQCWPEISASEEVEFAIAWKQPNGIFSTMPNLKVVSSLGAGCEHLVSDTTIPKNVKITRVIDQDLMQQMAEYVLTHILATKRRTFDYYAQKHTRQWQYLKPLKGNKVVILGAGILGDFVAQHLLKNNFEIAALARHEKYTHYPVYTSLEQLKPELKEAHYVVNLLPVTSCTTELINADFFNAMNSQSYFINVGRGATVVEADLINALQHKTIAGAVLDVFTQEPLAHSNPLWLMPNVIITPHIAAISKPSAIIELLVENYGRMKQKLNLLFEVDRDKQY